MSIRNIKQNITIQASSSVGEFAVLFPDVGDGRALEEEEEEIHGGEEEDDGEGPVDDVDLVFFGGEAEVEGGDGELDDGGGWDVEEFADEDILFLIFSVLKIYGGWEEHLL